MTSLQSIDNIEDRVDALLRRIAKGAERRDQIIETVSQTVTDTGSLSTCVEELRTVSRCMLLSFVHSSANLARTIAVSASLAERSSRRVKRLDLLLRRVCEAKTIADAMQEMRCTVSLVRETIEKGDMERTVELIRNYEDASVRLGGRSLSALLLGDGNDTEKGEINNKNIDGYDVVDMKNNEATEKENRMGDDNTKETSHVPVADLWKESNNDESLGNDNNLNSNVSGGDDGHNHQHFSHNEVEKIIASAREATREKLLGKFRIASRENDKLTIMHTTRLIAQLGFNDEGCSLYCIWMCEHTIAALRKMVERELRRMDDPNEAAMSHLALVSTALDIVVAAFEGEEEFTRETFGDKGVIKLLTELHSKSTTQCVPVLKDFLKKRQEVLCFVTAIENTTCGDVSGIRNNNNNNNKLFTTTTTNNNSGNSNNSGGSGSGPSSASYSPTTRTMDIVSVDPRRTDQILEEMSHLVSCCHLYLTFAQSKQQEYSQSVENGKKQQEQHEQLPKPHVGSDTIVSADSLWSSRDNPLMNVVQEILAVFVPLQKMYFDAAFKQIFQLQMDALRGAGKDTVLPFLDGGHERTTSGYGNSVKSVGNSSKKSEMMLSPSTKKATAFMTGLATLYTSTTTGGGAVIEDEHEQDAVYQHVNITLPDDMFFFLRIALHRAVNTRSTQIISAVFIACIELVQSMMIPVLQMHTTLPPTAQLQQLQQKRPGHTVPLRVMRWTYAAQCTATYTHKLADELRQLARANFTGKDVLRFTEQAEDMDVVSRDLVASVTQWITQFSEVCYQVYFAPYVERFSELSYNLTEDVFYHYELSDPWVRACVTTADVVLQPFDEYLGPHCFDKFLFALVQRIVKSTWRSLLQKTFSGYGALQIDREIRTLRAFFLGRAHELQLRESFLPLSSAASLLLLDNLKDAEQDVYEGLSAEEKRSVLGCRVDFQRADIVRLKL